MNHIKPKRLFELSQKDPPEMRSELDEVEKQHLRECDQCQQILAVLARQFDESRPPHDRDSNSSST